MVTPLLAFVIGISSGLLLGCILMYLYMSKKKTKASQDRSSSGGSYDEMLMHGSSFDLTQQINLYSTLMNERKSVIAALQQPNDSIDIPEWCKEMKSLHQTNFESLCNYPVIPDIMAIIPKESPDLDNKISGQ